MTRRQRITIAAACLVLAGLVFFSRPIAVLLGLEHFIHAHRYDSSDGGFEDVEIPEKGRSFAIVQSSFRRYVEESKQPDIQLFRTFPKERWRFWNWRDHASHPRWRLPYRPSVALPRLADSSPSRCP